MPGRTKEFIELREMQETAQFRLVTLFDELRLMRLLLENLDVRAPVYLRDLTDNCKETFSRIENLLDAYR